MRRFVAAPFAFFAASALMYACSAHNGSPGFGTGDDGGGSGDDGGNGTDGSSPGDDGGMVTLEGGGHDTGTVMTTNTIYAHTDKELYSMDPMSHVVKDIGPFAGMGAATTCDTAVTDLAINGNNEVYVNTETVVYKATLPSGGTGTVQLTKLATIAPGCSSTSQKFYALAFAPAGVLGSGEALVGGDDKGNLYYIDSTSGNTKLLGGFGGDWQLSGDLVFYTQNGMNLGLATIRSCPVSTTTGKPVCSKTNDSLAEIDMTTLANAYSGTAGAPLLVKTYGTGTTFGELYGVGAWGDKVYAFSRAQTGTTTVPAQLVQIDGTGVGTSLQMFNVTSGWSGAGVTTKATITVPPPPR